MSEKSTMLQILKQLKPYRLQVAAILLTSIINVVFTLYAPILIGEGVDTMLGEGLWFSDTLLLIVVKLAVVIAAASIAQWLMNIITNHIAFNMVQTLREQTFAHMHRLPVRYMDEKKPGDLISRILVDVGLLSDGLLLGFTQLFTGVITILGTIFFMFSIDSRISIMVIVITPLSLFVARFIARRTFHLFQEQSEQRARMTELVEELVGNEKVIQAFSYEQTAGKRFATVNAQLQESGVKSLFYSALTNPSTRFVNAIVYASVAVLGAFTVVSGSLSVGQLSSFLNYANQYTKPFNEISSVITEFTNALSSAKRIFEFLAIPAEQPDAPTATEYLAGKGEIVVSQADFSYEPEHPILRNISFTANPGQHVALVGPSGCGKTTMINMLMRFYDVDKGSIALDGISTDAITRDSLRKNMGMVLQETWLRTGTIRENIAYGRPEAPLEEVIAAAQKANAHGFIRRLPQGYDTMILHGGENVSRGQQQLLCIARLMLLQPQILLLDEATSSIDTRTERKVSEAFDELMEGRTSIVVAHRLSTIQGADVILVMNQGEIIERGRHEELMRAGGFYKQLYESQFEPA
ncbi:MAG: ABC transporter ATP-binding protein [Lachnospiraceae bacterium]